MPKRRLDTLLAERGLFDTRTRAAAAVMAGDVRVGDRPARKPGELVAPDAALEVAERPAFVSRGGTKLANAIEALGVDPAGRRALDVGASTGGFTDCLLQRGADAVVALDVAYGELHWTLRNDPRVTVIERRNARSLAPGELPWEPDLIVADVSFISLTKVLPAVLACAAPRFDCLALVKPQFEVGRERVGKGGVVRGADDRRDVLVDVAAHARDELGAAVLGFASSGLPGPAGNRESFVWLAEAGRTGGGPGPGCGGKKSGTVTDARRPPRSITIFSHTRPADTGGALRRIVELASEAGVEVRLPAAEVEKFGSVAGVAEADGDAGTDLAVVLGGDGTILTALREFAGTGVPVFAINYGAIGFLATIEPWELEDGFRRALRGEFDVMELPGLVALTADGERLAINDVSLHRRQSGRVAELAYSVEGEQLGEVRCDGLVVSTPAGSTGYNLANGGPVLAWGVEGFVVSFIAPHTLTARALVVAPGDTLEVTNRSHSEEVDVSTDARGVCALAPEAKMRIEFKHRQSLLAQAPGATFYHRLRDKFGRLSY